MRSIKNGDEYLWNGERILNQKGGRSIDFSMWLVKQGTVHRSKLWEDCIIILTRCSYQWNVSACPDDDSLTAACQILTTVHFDSGTST